MRFANLFSRGVAMVGALTLPFALIGVDPSAALAAGTSLGAGSSSATGAHAGAAAAGTAAHSGTGENTPLNLKPSVVHHAASSGGSGIVRTIIALVIVIAVIYAVARILKAVKGGQQKAKGDGLSHLATLPLGPNKSVALVRSGADIVLVGIADSGVTPIKTYTEQEAIDNGLIAPESDELPERRRDVSFEGFLETLRKITVRA